MRTGITNSTDPGAIYLAWSLRNFINTHITLGFEPSRVCLQHTAQTTVLHAVTDEASKNLIQTIILFPSKPQ